MASETNDLLRALEEQTAATKRQNTLLGQMETALTDAVGVNEGLKTAMMKSGRFSEDKMFKITETLANSFGDFDKGMKANLKMLSEGFDTKGLESAIQQITALGLNFQPFQNLLRHMDRELGFSKDQQVEQVKHLLALRKITQANPEMMAQQLQKISGVMKGAAGLFGPGFAKSFQTAVSVLAGDSPELVSSLTQAFSKAMGPGADGVRIRAMLGMPRDLTGMSPQGVLSMMMSVIQKTQGSFFGDFMRKSVLGKLVGFSPRDFAAFGTASSKMKGRNVMGDMSKALVALNQKLDSGDLMEKWNTMINKIINPMKSVWNVFMENIRKWATPLMGKLAQWSKQSSEVMQDWIASATKWWSKQKGTDTYKAMSNNADLIMSEIKQGLTAMFSAGEGEDSAFNGILDMIGGFIKFLWNALPRYFGNMMLFIQNFGAIIGAAGMDIIGAAMHSLKTLLSTIKSPLFSMDAPEGAAPGMSRSKALMSSIGWESAGPEELAARQQMKSGWEELKGAAERGFPPDRMDRIESSFKLIGDSLGSILALMADGFE
tara:strand:- start:213 stop:1850 length:1638 start_codon:yes stop_codon:yes gene_type:complete